MLSGFGTMQPVACHRPRPSPAIAAVLPYNTTSCSRTQVFCDAVDIVSVAECGLSNGNDSAHQGILTMATSAERRRAQNHRPKGLTYGSGTTGITSVSLADLRPGTIVCDSGPVRIKPLRSIMTSIASMPAGHRVFSQFYSQPIRGIVEMSDKPDVITAVRPTTTDLEALDLFRGEEPGFLHWVLHSCRVGSLVPGEILLEPGNNNDALYIILSGRAEVQLTHDDPGSSISLKPGECAGELSLIDGTSPSAMVVAKSHCQVLIIDAEVIWLLIERSSVVARNLMHILSTRMRKNNLELVQSHIQCCIHERDALHDSLTRLKNRRWIETTFAGIVNRCKREGEPLALLMIDTDYFKRYNDAYGHMAGDQLLVAVARVINQNIQTNSHACRYGGDEFVVVLPHIDAPEATEIAEHICCSIRETIPHAGDTRVSVSIGVASLEPGMHGRQLLASADAALYRAKAAGRDRISR